MAVDYNDELPIRAFIEHLALVYEEEGVLLTEKLLMAWVKLHQGSARMNTLEVPIGTHMQYRYLERWRSNLRKIHASTIDRAAGQLLGFFDSFFSRAMRNALSTIKDKPGIYFFYNIHRVPVYVGRSKDLSKRIPVSVTEDHKCLVTRYVSFMIMPIHDQDILERLYIRKYNPVFNKEFKINHDYGDDFNIEHPYNHSPLIKMYDMML